MGTRLQTLPNELLHQIFGYVRDTQGRSGFKRLSLTCKQLRYQTLPFIFDTVAISCSPKDLEVFLEWTSNPQLACYIRNVEYHIEPWAPTLTKEVYTSLFLMYFQHAFASDLSILAEDDEFRTLLAWRFGGEDLFDCLQKHRSRPLFGHFFTDKEICHDGYEASRTEPKPKLTWSAADSWNGAEFPSLPIEEIVDHPIIQEGYDHYMDKTREAMELWTSGTFEMGLKAGFRTCHNMQQLHIVTDYRQLLISPEALLRQGPKWRDWYDPNRHSPQQRSWNVLYLPPDWLALDNDTFTSMRSPEIEYYNVSQEVELIMEILSQTDLRPTHLLMSPSTTVKQYKNPATGSIYIERPQAAFPKYEVTCFPPHVPAYSTIKCLHLHLGDQFIGEHGFSKGSRTLLHMLPYLSNLEELSLYWVIHEDDITNRQYTLADSFPINHRFPALRTVKVSRFLFKVEELKILLRNSPQIQDLVLHASISEPNYETAALPHLWSQLSQKLLTIPRFEIYVPYRRGPNYLDLTDWSPSNNPSLPGETLPYRPRASSEDDSSDDD
ncbi:hypothetical protein MMC25_007672 [Agyrium rufum]|nr:hypothetical protein [Agyrium rufum]